MNFSSFFSQFAVLQEHLLLQQLLILAFYALAAKVTDMLIDQVLRRLARSTRIGCNDNIINIIHWPIVWTILLLGVLHALVLRTMAEPYQTVLPALTKSATLLVWLIALIRVLNFFAATNLSRLVQRGKIGRDVFLLLKNIIRVVIVVAGGLWILAIWDVDLTPLFASAGIAGIAVALAAKDTLANFFGGISIFMDNTFKVGDYIILDNLQRGEVAEIGIRSTRIKTRDDVLITIPNSIVANSKIINQSAPIPNFRIRIPVGVAYDSDLDKVEEVLMGIVLANPKVINDPAPRVRYRTFADSSINLELLVWIGDPAQRGLETHNLIKAIHRAFEQNGITIPFPQRDVHFHGVTANAVLPQHIKMN